MEKPGDLPTSSTSVRPIISMIRTDCLYLYAQQINGGLTRHFGGDVAAESLHEHLHAGLAKVEAHASSDLPYRGVQLHAMEIIALCVYIFESPSECRCPSAHPARAPGLECVCAWRASSTSGKVPVSTIVFPLRAPATAAPTPGWGHTKACFWATTADDGTDSDADADGDDDGDNDDDESEDGDCVDDDDVDADDKVGEAAC